MHKLFYTFIIGSLIIGNAYGSEIDLLPIPQQHVNNFDSKNVLAQVKNMVILRSFEESFWGKDVNSRNCYLEAYDIETGDLLWRHKDSGMIVSFIIVNDKKLIYRNYYHLTAINLSNGAVIWSKKTKGEFSTIQGE
jgi:outer membrane protein assembly factor BamB